MVLTSIFTDRNWKAMFSLALSVHWVSLVLSGYHADTPITIKAEAIRKADSRSH